MGTPNGLILLDRTRNRILYAKFNQYGPLILDWAYDVILPTIPYLPKMDRFKTAALEKEALS